MKNLKGYTVSRNKDVDMAAADTDRDSRYREAEEGLKEAYSVYGGMNSDELMAALRLQVNKQKRDGTYSADIMRQQMDMLRPYLSAEKIAELNKILDL